MSKLIFPKRCVLALGFATLPVLAHAQAEQPPANPPAPLGSRSTVVEPPPVILSPEAQAQSRRSQKPFVRVVNPLRLRVGALVPTTNRVRDEIDTSLFTAGLALDIAQTRGIRPTAFSAYVDVVYGQNQDHGPVNRLVSAGIGISARTYLKDDQRSTRPYAGLGIGVYTVAGKRDRLEAPTATIDGVTVSRLRYVATDEDRATFGGKVFVGAEFSKRYFGEIGFTAAGSVIGYNPNGVVLAAGVRF